MITTLDKLTEYLDENKNNFRVLVIDGKSGSGKSTYAAELAQLWQAQVIHMDDFYLPEELRTPERLSEPGGNVHYERFKQEVLVGIASRHDFSYGKFDCSSMKITEQIPIKSEGILIIEGSYSLHPYFDKYYDISVFLDIDADEQINRIIARNGAVAAERFRDRWIPMENRYFDTFSIADKCDYIIRKKET